jgi:uncharacterized membrane protein YheB (UPF0754 family)
MDWHSLLAVWSLPLIGAFNGWFTTFLGIRMLFRPRQPVRFLGLSYQAPLPRRQAEIAQRIGDIVEEELINYSDIQAEVVTPQFLKRVARTIEGKIGDMLVERRASFPSLMQKVLTDDVLRYLRRKLAKEVAAHLPELSDEMFTLLSKNVSIRHLIAQKVAAFELQRLEEVIFSLASRELRLIELFCAVLGFAIGTAQLVLTLMR